MVKEIYTLKLYKFRSLENFKYTADILLNQRLHCATIDSLNDPFEGLFYHIFRLPYGAGRYGIGVMGGKRIKKQSHINQHNYLGTHNICSLSANMSDVRLWSYYADGHKGIAIELEISEDEEKLHKVQYNDQVKETPVSLLTRGSDILKTKTRHWEHEQEYRIITEDTFYSVEGAIKAVYTGLRTSQADKELLEKILPPDVPIIHTELEAETVTITPIT